MLEEGQFFYLAIFGAMTYLPYTLNRKTYTEKGICHFVIDNVCVISSLNDFVSYMFASRQHSLLMECHLSSFSMVISECFLSSLYPL